MLAVLTVHECFRCLSDAMKKKDFTILKAFCLTLSQTTNFGLFQTEEFADDNFKFYEIYEGHFLSS